MSINITVIGRLTKDPELRKTQSGKLVTSFGLTHNFRKRAGNQFKDVTTVFFDASVWQEDGAVEVAELGLTKGHPCHRRGRLVQADSDHQGWPTPHQRRTDGSQDSVVH
jgi:single-stranded DNA-binding protein